MPIRIKEKPERNSWGKIINALSHPAWTGVAGLIALVGALVALFGYVLPFILSLPNPTQNVTLWLSEPLAVPRYVMVSGAIVLIAIILATIQHYLSSHATPSFRQRLSRNLVREWLGRAEPTAIFLSIPLPAQIANAYLKDRYLDLPSRIITPNDDKVEFQLPPDSLILDTNIIIHYVTPRDYDWEEFGFSLPKPIQNIKSVYFLINSGNSLITYQSFTVGKIKLIFRDAPPIVTDLVLGKNIREWCIGNPGNLVREVSDHTANNLAWKGENKAGVPAVMDYLKIPVFECMRNNPLEQIIFARNKASRSPDTMGVPFSVFGISLEIE
jgi:hypothetical protein